MAKGKAKGRRSPWRKLRVQKAVANTAGARAGMPTAVGKVMGGGRGGGRDRPVAVGRVGQMGHLPYKKYCVGVCVSKGEHHEAKSMVLSLTDVTVLSLFVAKLVSASVCLNAV